MKKLPREILIYVADFVDGEYIYGVALNVDEIPEDVDQKVGVYTLNKTCKFSVKRELA